MSARSLLGALRDAGLSVAVAESLTGGLVTSALVDIPGASAVLRGGVVAYATEVKHAVLGVDADLLSAVGPVNGEVALQMAAGVARALGADMGLATTGVAGPDPSDGFAAGTVYLAVVICTETGVINRCEKHLFSGGRPEVRALATQKVLDLGEDLLRDREHDTRLERWGK